MLRTLPSPIRNSTPLENPPPNRLLYRKTPALLLAAWVSRISRNDRCPVWSVVTGSVLIVPSASAPSGLPRRPPPPHPPWRMHSSQSLPPSSACLAIRRAFCPTRMVFDDPSRIPWMVRRLSATFVPPPLVPQVLVDGSLTRALMA